MLTWINHLTSIFGLLSPHPLKSNSGIDTFPRSSGAFLCLLESGEPPAFWFSTPNTLRPRIDSRGSTATAMGKLILEETRSRVRREERGEGSRGAGGQGEQRTIVMSWQEHPEAPVHSEQRCQDPDEEA